MNMRTGTLHTLLILSVLKDRPMYGYEISQEIAAKSNQKINLQIGILYKLVEEGYIAVDAETVVNKRIRVYYRIEDKGIKYLEALKDIFRTTVSSICDVLHWDVAFSN